MLVSSNKKQQRRFKMTVSQKFFSLALAAAFFLPAALAAINQAAQIVA
jgi:hypothetical protein